MFFVSLKVGDFVLWFVSLNPVINLSCSQLAERKAACHSAWFFSEDFSEAVSGMCGCELQVHSWNQSFHNLTRNESLLTFCLELDPKKKYL